MYKEAIISIIIVICIITANYFLQDFTQRSVNTMTDELQELKEALFEKETEKINSKMEEIDSKWEDIDHKMAFFIEHDELEKVKTDLVTLKGYIEVEDYDTSISELNKSVFVLEHIARKYDFNLVNIF